MSSKQTVWRIFVVLMIMTPLVPVHNTTAQTSSGTSPLCNTPPPTINVQIVAFQNEWPFGTEFLMGVPFEDYVYGVVMGELGPVVPDGVYAGQAWSDEVIKAQSVAARTWGTYYCTKWAFNGSRGVKNGEEDQVYRPNYDGFGGATKQHFIDVSYAMRDIYIAYDGRLVQSPYNGKLLDAEYRRDVGFLSSCSWLSGDQRAGCLLNGQRVFGYDYLRSVDNVYSMYTDGPGWGQMPSQGWVRDNDRRASWYQTLVHYYTGISMMNRPPVFTADYWNNRDCSGAPVRSGASESINYDWGGGAPAPGVNADNFCVEWNRAFASFLYSDWYTFFVLADDGFRLYFDGALILDRWIDQAPTWYSVSLPVTAGSHNVLLRYYEHTGGAVARMSWIRGRGMIGTYYDTLIPKTDPISAPAFILRPDALIQFDWGPFSSPLDALEGPRIAEDTFAARWQGEIYIPSCRWVTFNTRSDDGVYIKFNNAGLIDNRNDHAPTDNTAQQWLCQGTYPLRMRYYENGGGAVINVAWQ